MRNPIALSIPGNNIMDTKLVLRKLRHAEGSGGYVINAPEDLAMEFEGAGLSSSPKKGVNLKFALVFVRNKAEVQEVLAPALGFVEYDGVLWAVYPKGGALGTDLNRDILWKLIEPLEYRPVSQVAIDAQWSAMRLRPTKNVKEKRV